MNREMVTKTGGWKVNWSFESTDRNEDREEPSRRGGGIDQPLRQEGQIEQNGQEGIFWAKGYPNARKFTERRPSIQEGGMVFLRRNSHEEVEEVIRTGLAGSWREGRNRRRNVQSTSIERSPKEEEEEEERGERRGGTKPTHRLAPAVRQDTKYR